MSRRAEKRFPGGGAAKRDKGTAGQSPLHLGEVHSLPHRCASLIAMLVALGAPSLALSDVMTDSSWGRTPQPLSGAMIIPESMGKLAGTNLFHSFQRFNVDIGESATFTTTTNTIQNLISRVSGTEASSINGLLRLAPAAGSAPNFFFVNPNGVTFSAGAQIDVPGTFHVSTANYLRLKDDNGNFTLFNAGLGPDSTLTAAAPESFGFLGGGTMSRVQFDTAPGIFSSGPSFNVTAGTIDFRDSTLISFGGDIKLRAVGAGPSIIPVASAVGVDTGGSISITNSLIGADPGRAELQGKTILLEDGKVVTLAEDLKGGDIVVTGQVVTVRGGNSQLSTLASDGKAGSAGNIIVHASQQLLLSDSAHIDSTTFGSIDPDPTVRSSQTSTGSTGMISINAAALTIERNASIGNVSFLSPGRAGDISLSISGSLVIRDGAKVFVQAPTNPYFPIELKRTGSISVKAKSVLIESTEKDGSAGIFGSSIDEFGGPSPAADLFIEANTITMRGVAEISAATFTDRPAGNITIKAQQMVVDGADAFIQAMTIGAGGGGRIHISAGDNLSLLNGGVIATLTAASGPAGNVVIDARSVNVDGSGGIFTGSSQAGAAGDIEIYASEIVSLVNGGQLSAKTKSSGKAGSISVSAQNLYMDGANIVASSEASAPASAVHINANDNVTMRNSAKILTTAQDGNGGPIDVAAGRYISMHDSQIATSVLGQTNGNGGNISITAPVLVLNTGFIQANTAAPRATGGDINIDVGALIPSGNTLTVGGTELIPFQPGVFGLNVIQAAAPDGVSGNIQIASPALDVAGSLAGLEAQLIDFGALGRDMCRIGAGSSMTRVGRGGQPPSIFDAVRPETPAMTPRGL